MPRYFFHARTGSTREVDDEGLLFPDLPTARHQAILGARDLVADMALEQRDATGWSIEITDEQGTVLAIVTFQEALEGIARTAKPRVFNLR
jgi:hypothetical protein